MNAGGVLNTCKSNVAIHGGRVSNAWAICPYLWDNSWKRLIIPHNMVGRHLPTIKDLSDMDELASD